MILKFAELISAGTWIRYSATGRKKPKKKKLAALDKIMIRFIRSLCDINGKTDVLTNWYDYDIKFADWCTSTSTCILSK